jgi:hypothetical protein
MVNENNELIIELWSRIKSHIPPKERLEVADIFIVVFDEFGKVDDDLMDEDLDKELRAAVRSHIGDPLDVEEDEAFDDEDY